VGNPLKIKTQFYYFKWTTQLFFCSLKIIFIWWF